MDGKRFDELSRTLAKGVSRRQALKGAVGGLLGAVGLRQAADAQVTQASCGNVVCYDPRTQTQTVACAPGCVCCVFGNTNSRCMPANACFGTVVTTTTTPAPTTTTTTTAAATTTTTTTLPATTTTTTTLPATTTTTTTFVCSPPGGSCQGLGDNGCCNRNCSNATQTCRCDDGTDTCGGICCDANEVCESNICVCNNAVCGGNCCPPGGACSGPNGDVCCQTAVCPSAGPGGVCCAAGSACCSSGDSCAGGCCPNAVTGPNGECCDPGETNIGGACCPVGQECGPNVCCPTGQICEDSATGTCGFAAGSRGPLASCLESSDCTTGTCCTDGAGGSICCGASGQVCNFTELGGRCDNAPGSLPLGAGCISNIACASGACCGGVCVDTQNDPNNCGGCGTTTGDVCEAGDPALCEGAGICVNGGCGFASIEGTICGTAATQCLTAQICDATTGTCPAPEPRRLNLSCDTSAGENQGFCDSSGSCQQCRRGGPGGVCDPNLTPEANGCCPNTTCRLNDSNGGQYLCRNNP